ncbi:PLP-dependent aminotransferase family protein [Lichenibacterium minor]|uniref:PLP-dependent aminotransferase family protein n=1 Tax=Lichenibacterium minor TaxID=2316528 RepID=A0A4Q2UDI2_9HYPH|nr:PLP-dependent aminotransferase family protein [Lichenibacterium minor]RYC33267.1 PLP-dependent aminotransferase family protein [Lichenibacterium minor]
MTLWTPDLAKFGRPHYRAIADAIADDIGSGRLSPSDRLPPQRRLADALGLNFSTVARGYVEAQRRGLIASRVGQGTVVAGPPAGTRGRDAAGGPRRPALVDFSMNLPPEPDDPDLLGRMRDGLAAVSADLTNLLRYQGFGGAREDREAALAWLARRGLAPAANRLLVCPGAHSALLAVLSTLCRPGDAVCCEALTYPGARSIAAHLGLELIGLPTDREGIDAAAFAATCAKHRPKALYLNPTLLNPTTQTVSRARRDAIVEVARRYAVAIVEDDAYGVLPPSSPPPFAALAPETTYHVAGLSKCLGAGLRIAYLVAPSARTALPVAASLRAATVMASPITAALATRWITDGTADAVLGFVRAESIARQRLAVAALPAARVEADPHGFHVWMRLPDPWTRSAFASQVRSTGIGVVASDPFVAAGAAPEAVRICLGGLANRDDVAHALDVIAHALDEAPVLSSAFI